MHAKIRDIIMKQLHIQKHRKSTVLFPFFILFCEKLIVFYIFFGNFHRITPVLKIVQIFLNDNALYNAIVDLPTSTNFLGAVTTIATSKKFAAIQGILVFQHTCFRKFEEIFFSRTH